MIVSIIAAVDENNGIGLGGRLPWKISSDLKRFKRLTMGHHVVMGRKTWESIGRALPGRTNIIISQSLTNAPENTILKPSIKQALEFAALQGETELFIIGGGQVYAQALPFTHRIYLSRIHETLQADTYFPILDWENWVVCESAEFPATEKDQYPYTFMILERRDTPTLFG